MLFEPNDEALQSVIRSRIISDLERLEDRIECDEGDISFVTETEEGVNYLYVNITYKIIKYDTYYTSKIKVGEIDNE